MQTHEMTSSMVCLGVRCALSEGTPQHFRAQSRAVRGALLSPEAQRTARLSPPNPASAPRVRPPRLLPPGRGGWQRSVVCGRVLLGAPLSLELGRSLSSLGKSR